MATAHIALDALEPAELAERYAQKLRSIEAVTLDQIQAEMLRRSLDKATHRSDQAVTLLKVLIALIGFIAVACFFWRINS